MKKGLLKHCCAAFIAAFMLVQLAAGPNEAVAAPKKVKIAQILKKKGLNGVPSNDKALAAKKKKKKRSHSVGIAAVTGTPPSIVSIPGLDVSNLFWPEGDISAIASGSPTQDQCMRFWSGMGACQMVENVGYSFAQISEADTSLCYMKKIPTDANYATGAITVVSGEFPDGKPNRLFVPGEEARTVHVRISGGGGHGPGEQNVFIRVPGRSELASARNAYAVNLWFCAEGSINGYNRISIGNDGRMQADSAHRGLDGPGGGNSTFVSSIIGYLTASDAGAISWDTARSREASSAFVSEGEQGGSFKSDIIIRSNELETKSVDTWGSDVRKTYNISGFSGSSLQNVALREGAFKGSGQFGDYRAATEYQTPRYVSADQSALAQRVQQFDIGGDSYYGTTANPALDTEGFACDAASDIELVIDMSNRTLQESVQDCEQERGDMHFCFSNELIQAAERQWGMKCMIH